MSLLFKSAFGTGVTIQPPVANGDEWEQHIVGADQGYDWSTKLPMRPGFPAKFDYLVKTAHKLAPYAEARIDNGSLYMGLKKQDPMSTSGTRVSLGIYPPDSFRQAYARYSVTLQPNLGTDILPITKNLSRQFTELRETGNDFRISMLIVREKGKPDLFWRTQGQFGATQHSPMAWTFDSKAPVPLKKFIFEVFWKLGVTDGRFVAKVDGVPIIEYTGQTMKNTGLYVWWPFKVYTGTNLKDFGEKVIYQNIDDFELWTEHP